MSVSISGLTHVYIGASESVVALSGVELDLESGSVTVVRGPNGSGKTTLVRILAGDLQATAGTVRLDADGRAPRIVTLRQFGNVVPELSVAEHATLMRTRPLARDWAGLRAGSLEPGDQQQLAVDLALARDPDVVLADEPTANLTHPEAVAVYRALAEQCRDAGATLILVTHDVRAEAFADHVVRLRDGRIAERWVPGQPEEAAIDSAGWLRLPDSVRPRFGGAARVVDGDVVTLAGAAPHTATASAPVGDGAGGAVTHVVSNSAIDGRLRLEQLLAEHSGNAALFGDAAALGTAQCLADMGPSWTVMDTLDVTALSRRPLATLSGGQRQRAMLALALSHPAPVLLIDEPTASLDAHWRDACMTALRDAAAAGRTVVVATRDTDTIGARDEVITL